MMSHTIAPLCTTQCPSGRDARSRCLDWENPDESHSHRVAESSPEKRVVHCILFTSHSTKINPLMLRIKEISRNIMLFKEDKSYHV